MRAPKPPPAKHAKSANRPPKSPIVPRPPPPSPTARAGLKKTARGAHAPYAAVDAIEAGIHHGFDAGSEREIELFADCVLSAESRNLIRLFFAEREVDKVPDVPKDTPTAEIRAAAVVGAGTMGGGIAMNYANAGIPVLLKESDQAALDRGLATIRKNYEISASKGKMTPRKSTAPCR